MALLAPNVGENRIGEFVTNKATPGDVIYHIYTNNYTPVAGSVLANFTESADGLYAPQTIPGADWAWATAGGIGKGQASVYTFNFGAAATLYGYYVTDNGGTRVLWAERFGGAPITFGSDGGQVLLTPTLTVT